MIRQRKVVDNAQNIPDLYDVKERIVFLCEKSSKETVWETIITRVQKEVAIKLLLQEI